MNIFNHFRKLVPPVLKSSVLLEQIGVFRSVCSVHRARFQNPSLLRFNTANIASCQRWHHEYTSQFDTKRSYSDVCSNDSSNLKQDPFQEESPEMDSKSTDRSSSTFSLDMLVSLLRQENAVDICVIEVPEKIKYTDYFIVVSGVSPRHLRAMALYAIKVYKFLKKAEQPNVKIEGKDAEDWMCIDFGNMVVHFMLSEAREVYELEKLWTLRAYDEQLMSMPAETLPEDYIYDAEDTK